MRHFIRAALFVGLALFAFRLASDPSDVCPPKMLTCITNPLEGP